MNFYDLYPGEYLKYDIRVNTAARLSASFPYVAPAARPDSGRPVRRRFPFRRWGLLRRHFGIVSFWRR